MLSRIKRILLLIALGTLFLVIASCGGRVGGYIGAGGGTGGGGIGVGAEVGY